MGNHIAWQLLSQEIMQVFQFNFHIRYVISTKIFMALRAIWALLAISALLAFQGLARDHHCL